MPRFARVVVLDEPYHITHRGNHRANVFFEQEDREIYLAMLTAACRRFQLDVWAYCLMSNHVHLLAVPRALAGTIRQNTSTGRPTASMDFIKRIEAMLERELAPPRKRGRPHFDSTPCL